jgi:hypothetical protein
LVNSPRLHKRTQSRLFSPAGRFEHLTAMPAAVALKNTSGLVTVAWSFSPAPATTWRCLASGAAADRPQGEASRAQ